MLEPSLSTRHLSQCRNIFTIIVLLVFHFLLYVFPASVDGNHISESCEFPVTHDNKCYTVSPSRSVWHCQDHWVWSQTSTGTPQIAFYEWLRERTLCVSVFWRLLCCHSMIVMKFGVSSDNILLSIHTWGLLCGCLLAVTSATPSIFNQNGFYITFLVCNELEVRL